MKYKVAKESLTGGALTALAQSIKEADNAARAFVKAKGFSANVVYDTVRVGGGLAGFHFSEKPKDWKRVFNFNGVHFYWPIEGRKSTREILSELRALPMVRVFEYNDVIQWDGFLSRYGLADRGEWWLLDVPEARDVAPPAAPGLVEITSTEYQKLYDTPAPSAPPTEKQPSAL